MTPASFQRPIDALLLAGVCLHAAMAITRNEFGSLAEGTTELQWYSLAGLYAGIVWVSSPGLLLPGWLWLLARWGLVIGLVLCSMYLWQTLATLSHADDSRWPYWLLLWGSYVVRGVSTRFLAQHAANSGKGGATGPG